MGLGLVLNRSRQVAAEDSPAFGAIAERFRRAGDLERSVALCQEGLQRFPNHVSARVTLGWAYLDLGRFDEARAELEQVLKRAPDNLAAIRGLAELHDRSEHDEVAAMQRSGVKWIAEQADMAAEADAAEAFTKAAASSAMPASMAAADPLAPVGEPEIDETLEALKAFSSGAFVAPSPEPVPAAPSFAAPAVAFTPPAPSRPSVAAPDPLAAGPWQPVEIETAAARVLSAVAPTPVVVEPVQLTSAADAIASASSSFAAPSWVPEPVDAPVVPELAAFETPAAFAMASAPVAETPQFAMPTLDEFDAPMPVPDMVGAPAFDVAPEMAALAPAQSFHAAETFESFEPTASFDDMAFDEAFDAPVEAAPAVQPLVLTPVVEMPEALGEEFDPALPAGAEEWAAEMTPDVYVLPAAVEAARATADEGPGPWPPVIADDPVEEVQVAAAVPMAAPVAPTPIRRPNVGKLNKFLRRVEGRRATVMAQLAG